MANYRIIPYSREISYKIENSTKFSELKIYIRNENNTIQYRLWLDCHLSSDRNITVEDKLTSRSRREFYEKMWHQAKIRTESFQSADFRHTTNSLDEAIKFIDVLNENEPIDERNYNIIVYCLRNQFIPKNESDLSTIPAQRIAIPRPQVSVPASLFHSSVPNISNALKAFIEARQKASESNLVLSTEFGLDAAEYDLDCTISKDFPEIPVTFNGRFYDFNELIKLNLDGKGFINDPETRENLSIETIQPDYRSQKAMENLLKIEKEKQKKLKTDASSNEHSEKKSEEQHPKTPSPKK